MGGQPQGLPLPGELAGAGPARRQVAVLRRPRAASCCRATSPTTSPRRPSSTTWRRSTRWPASRSPASTTRSTTTTRPTTSARTSTACTSSGAPAPHPAVYYYRSYDLNAGDVDAVAADRPRDQRRPGRAGRLQPPPAPVLAGDQREAAEGHASSRRRRPSTTPTTTPDPSNQLEIQLAWSLQTTTAGGRPKRMSRQKLVHPWQRPHSAYNLKPRYKPRENLLWLDLYLSTTAEFNNTTFYDHYAGAPTYVTATRFDEAIRPWHSSSFVFDGGVVDVKMKGLAGQYRLKNGGRRDVRHAVERPTRTTTCTTRFGADGTAINAAHRSRTRSRRGWRCRPACTSRTPSCATTCAARTRACQRARRRGQSTPLLDAARSPFELVVLAARHPVRRGRVVPRRR